MHHPIASALYYEDQKREAKRYAEEFRKERVPKYLGYFEKRARAQRAEATAISSARGSPTPISRCSRSSPACAMPFRS